MEAAGEIWIEEESPIFNQMKDNTSVTAVEVKVSSHRDYFPFKITRSGYFIFITSPN